MKDTITNAAEITILPPIDNNYKTGGGDISVGGAIVVASRGKPFTPIRVYGGATDYSGIWTRNGKRELLAPLAMRQPWQARNAFAHFPTTLMKQIPLLRKINPTGLNLLAQLRKTPTAPMMKF